MKEAPQVRGWSATAGDNLAFAPDRLALSSVPAARGLALPGPRISRSDWTAWPPGVLALLLAGAHLLLWGGALALSRHAPALDSAEQLVWSYAMDWGYWKHPPLPSWLMHALAAVFGRSVALPAIASQACVAIALLLTWRLGCALLSPRASLVAMGLSALVTCHNLGAEPFNHNTVLLPFQAGAMLLFYRAVRGGRWWHWAGFGALAGLGMLVKYVALIPLAALLLYALLDGACRNRRTLAGLALAGAVFSLVSGAHGYWLWTHDFLPLRYAHSVAVHIPGAGDYAISLAGFLFELGVSWLPLVLVLAWVRRPRAAPAEPLREVPVNDRLFLWVAGLGPLLLLLVYGTVTGTQLLPRWGSNLFLLAGWLALDLGRARGTPALRPALAAFAAVQLALCLATTVLRPVASDLLALRGRAGFPGAALSEQALRTWQSRTDAPLRLVITDLWTGGNLAAHQPRPLAVLLDGDARQAPWVTAGDVADCGALVLLNRTEFGNSPVPPGLVAYLADAPLRGEWQVPWPALLQGTGVDRSVHIGWGILPPVPGGHCAL